MEKLLVYGTIGAAMFCGMAWALLLSTVFEVLTFLFLFILIFLSYKFFS